jgi:hypothetical protein
MSYERTPPRLKRGSACWRAVVAVNKHPDVGFTGAMLQAIMQQSGTAIVMPDPDCVYNQAKPSYTQDFARLGAQGLLSRTLITTPAEYRRGGRKTTQYVYTRGPTPLSACVMYG